MAGLIHDKPPRLEMRGVSKRFGATVALDGVDLTVQSGCVHALIGENGAGKSTLMKVLSGAIRADEGSMRLDGEVFRPADPLAARRAGVGMIYQELSLCPHLTVEENITLAMEPSRFGTINGKEVRKRTARALEQLEHSELPADAQVGRLPIAMQQLVEIGRALATGCRVLVLDEPTSSLAEDDVERLFHLVRHLAEEDYAVVYISHFIEEIQQVADRYSVLRDGKGVAEGVIAEVSADEIVSMMIGRDIEDMYPRSMRTAGQAVLEIVDLCGQKKPESATLDLHAGEIVGIAGLVGSGRTELMRTVFGLDAVRSGRVRVGAYQGTGSPSKSWQQGVGYLSENRKDEGLAVTMSIADNVTLSSMPALVNPKKQAQATKEWIKRLDIRSLGPAQRVMNLSGGNQQKVALGRLLHHDVDVLLLDEPTRGIDVASKAQIYRLIDGLAAQSKKAVLMVSSYLPELLGVCDRIAVMCRGKLGPARPVGDWDEHKLMMEATGQEMA
jgi:ribose transport system ATP-binding protein